MAEEKPQPCRWCGAAHGPLCPSVKALEFDSYGAVTRVEFFSPGDLTARSEADPAEDYPRLGRRQT